MKRSRMTARKFCTPTHALRRQLEALEDRTVPATISVANATMNENGGASAFVASGSGGLNYPRDLTLGPDGNVYVASSATNSVIRYSGTTGQLIGTFVSGGSGGLSTPFGLAFGPDGSLYVDSIGTDAVYRYNGATGAFLNTYVSTGSGGLVDPTGIGFGTDGNLYVSSRGTNAILRYQGPTGPIPGSPLPSVGQTGATFVPPGSGGLNQPHDLAIGPDGDLYVASNLSSSVLKFDGTSGNFISTYVAAGVGGLVTPRGMAFDQEGRLYLADNATNAIHRFDSLGQYLDDPVAANGTSVQAPIGIAFDAQGRLLINSANNNAVYRYDGGVTVTLSQTSAAPVTVSYTTVDGTALAGADYTGQVGTVTFAPGQTSRRILLATNDDSLVEGNETLSVQLSGPTGGATIASGNAVVTIVDDDTARQVTITNASAVEGDYTARYRGAFVLGDPGHNFNGLTFEGGYLYTSPGPQSVAPIDRYDATTGAFVDHFIPAGRINGVRDKVFREGFWYIGSEGTDEVLRFDANGNFVDAFVPAGSGGIDGPHGLTFGPDVNGDGVPELYVTGRNSFNVVRYDGVTGQPLGSMNTSGAGALSYPEGIAISPGGVVCVASSGSNLVKRYNAVTGAYLGTVSNSGLVGPKDVKFGPDGLMYVLSSGNGRIMRFTASGAYVDDYVPAGSGGMNDLYRMAFGPDGDVYVTALGTNNQIFRFGTENEAVITVSLSTPSTLPVTVNYATADGTANAGSDYTVAAATLTFAPGVTSATIRVPILNDAVAEPTETFTVNLSNATGGVITAGQGVATIADDDATKFYVVNDGSPDQTYRYGAPGNSQGSSSLSSGDTAPRGVATTAAGTTVWVADANGTVYVYSPGGGLLGSWTAGGLPSEAQVEGIATNGTDIWLLDNKQDKVFKYTGAANRLSGSQSATSSFALNSGNSNGKGIVTDGTSFWVVNDAGTDKVYKYSLAGSLLGSWTIDAANSSPTGLTINPANVSDIWIVDNGTDKVYQYTAAAGRTAGQPDADRRHSL